MQGSAPGVRGEEEAEEELIVSLGMRVGVRATYEWSERRKKKMAGNVGDRSGHAVIGAHGIARMKKPSMIGTPCALSPLLTHIKENILFIKEGEDSKG